MTYRIELDGCINCGWCRRACPTDTIRFFTTHQRTHVIEPQRCIDCAICAHVCPVNVIAFDPTYVHEPVELEAAKERARGWARKQRQLKEQRRVRAAMAVCKLQERAASVA
jgi:NAD-dependent dihydropyrimidine dehydrogenase PreA subunit